MSLLADHVALVTGASRGIGLAIAEALRGAGARVVRFARSLQDGRGPPFIDFRCDVTDEGTVREAVGRLTSEIGVPDIVVNNAGTFLIKPLVETTARELLEQLTVNTAGPFIMLRQLLPHLTRRGSGRIVTIGSIADHRILPGNAAYGASKHALRALHEVLLEELAGTGVRATLISPGATDTRLWDSIDPNRRRDLPARASMLRPEDIAEAVLFAVTRPDRVNIDVLRLQPGR